MEILLIRHGEAAGDPHAEPGTSANGFLSALGISQARTLGQKLQGEKIDLAWTSTYGRAILTAAIALEGRNIPTTQFRFLREWFPNQEKAKEDATQWEVINASAADFYAEQTWKTDLGEGCLEMLARVGPPFLKELEKIGIHARHGGYVIEKGCEDLKLAVFAHGGSLGALIGFLLSSTVFPITRFNFELTGLARIRLKKQGDVWYPQIILSAPTASMPC